MILIGEKLNSSIPSALEALQARDEQAVTELIRRQAQAGADYLDVNTAICGDQELDRMLWALELVQKNCSCGIMIDSTDPAVMAQAAKAVQGRPLIFNSATVTDRFEPVTQLALEYGAGIVGMPIDDQGLPTSLEDKCAKIDRLVAGCAGGGAGHRRGERPQDGGRGGLCGQDLPGGPDGLRAIQYLLRAAPAQADQQRLFGGSPLCGPFGGHPGPCQPLPAGYAGRRPGGGRPG